MRRIPLEYGDNFPVSQGAWNPAVPWRFPKYQIRRPSVLSQLLPWMMLGLGMTLGVLWMCWRGTPLPGQTDPLRELSAGKTGAAVTPLVPSARPTEGVPRIRPKKSKSQLA